MILYLHERVMSLKWRRLVRSDKIEVWEEVWGVEMSQKGEVSHKIV